MTTTYKTVVRNIETDEVAATVYCGPSESMQSRMALAAQSKCNDEHYVDFIDEVAA